MLKVINDKSSFVVGNMVENASIILENIYICVCVYISHPMNRKQIAHGK